ALRLSFGRRRHGRMRGGDHIQSVAMASGRGHLARLPCRRVRDLRPRDEAGGSLVRI
ncbi:MAG: hypothetical protein AVDCRST_MAG91-1507, partial [uncultured Sphingomonadaceae bacterium]